MHGVHDREAAKIIHIVIPVKHALEHAAMGNTTTRLRGKPPGGEHGRPTTNRAQKVLLKKDEVWKFKVKRIYFQFHIQPSGVSPDEGRGKWHLIMSD